MLKVFHQRNEPPAPDRLGNDDVAEPDDSRPAYGELEEHVCTIGHHWAVDLDLHGFFADVE